MTHFYDVEIAREYGLEEAVIMQMLIFWIEKNAACGRNWRDGRTWTYNSASSMAVLFPEFSQRKIKRILQSLKAQGLIITGCYNKIAYDRTAWYSIADEDKYISAGCLERARELRGAGDADSAGQNGCDDGPEMARCQAGVGPYTGRDQPTYTRYIPDKKTDIVPDQEASPSQKAEKSFLKPKLEDIESYAKEKSLSIDPSRFFYYYESNGWRVGKNPMKSWRAAMHTWERGNREKTSSPPVVSAGGRELTSEELAKMYDEELSRMAKMRAEGRL